ncbi:MAG: NapC/NirT family cytochrome c [Mycobacteriaceae bacterium]
MRIRVTSRKVVVTAVVVTAFLVLTGFAMFSTSSRAFCGLCHNMKASVDALGRSAHAGVNCEQCHTKPGPFFFLTAKLEALQEPVKQFTGNYEEPILGVVQNASCRRCHTNKQLFPTISKSGINVNHKHLIEAGYQCVTCHSTVAHLGAVPQGSRTEPTMDQCLVCHNNHYTAADGTVAVSRCDLCHVEPASGTRPLTHTADWLQIHGSAGMLSTCTACHPQKPGEQSPAGAQYVSGLNCVSCHHGILMPHPETWLHEHGPVSVTKGEKSCGQCHDTKAYCSGCHRVPLPHPANFVATHPSVARSDADTCLNCHKVDNCNACHLAHQKGSPPAHRLLTGQTTGSGT